MICSATVSTSAWTRPKAALCFAALQLRQGGLSSSCPYKGEPVYIDGRPYYEVQYDVRMIMFLLEAWLPETYGNRPIVVVNLEDWNGDASRLGEDSRRELIEVLKRKAAEEDDAPENAAASRASSWSRWRPQSSDIPPPTSLIRSDMF